MQLSDLYQSPDDDEDIEEVERLWKSFPPHPAELGKKANAPEKDAHEEHRQKWLDAQLKTAEGRLAGVIKEVSRVLSAFKQRMGSKEADVEKEFIGFNSHIAGKNGLGDDVDSLFELRIHAEIPTKKVDVEIFSYWIDNEGTIDPTDISDEETIQSYKEWFTRDYHLEEPKLPDFGAPWLNNLAYICWALPQLQNEVSMSGDAKKNFQQMNHSNLLKANEWGTYKMLIKIPNAGTHTYYEEGTPQNLMSQFGPETIFIAKMA